MLATPDGVHAMRSPLRAAASTKGRRRLRTVCPVCDVPLPCRGRWPRQLLASADVTRRGFGETRHARRSPLSAAASTEGRRCSRQHVTCATITCHGRGRQPRQLPASADVTRVGGLPRGVPCEGLVTYCSGGRSRCSLPLAVSMRGMHPSGCSQRGRPLKRLLWLQHTTAPTPHRCDPAAVPGTGTQPPCTMSPRSWSAQTRELRLGRDKTVHEAESGLRRAT